MIKRGQKLLEKKREEAEDRAAMEEDGDEHLSDGPESDPEDDYDDDEEESQDEEMDEETGEKKTEKKKRTESLRHNRVLTIGSRGITARHRHLLKDLQQLLPHTRKESKMDARDTLSAINEICEMRTCTHAVFFDTRRHRDLYLSFAKSPDGPTLKFFVENIHTMAELNLTGNHLKGSRAILSFDPAFDSEPRWRIAKEILSQVFAVPRGHPRSKPFMDHVFMFTVQDDRIWFRNYQIVEQGERHAEERSLVEVGPRFTLRPVRYFAGSFGGPVIYENEAFVSPNSEATMEKYAVAQKKIMEGKKIRTYRASKASVARGPTEMDTLFQ